MNFNINELDKTYNKCMATGSIKEKNTVDVELIKSLKNVAERGLSFIKRESRNLKKDSDDWTFVFRDYYESLRGLIESFLLFYKIEAENHQCKNAYICFKHPELELDWNFLETIRLKRNAINYRGQLLQYEDWNKFKLKFELHINKLKAEIEKRLEEES
jgi:hypothetical protein